MKMKQMNMKQWGALLSAVTVIGVAGCADRNNNGQPDDAATPGEVNKAVGNAGDATGNMVDAAGNKVGGAADAGSAALMTPKIKTALGANASLKGSSIDVDSLPEGITLSGTVKNAAQKNVAGNIAKQQAPTYKINNQIRIAPGGASPMMNKKPMNNKMMGTPATKKAN